MLFAGLDVHRDSIQACLVDDSGQIVRESRFTTTSVGLNRLIETVQGANCVMESSTACFPVYDFLHDNGVHVRVAHPKRTKAICSARIKTDKVDARMLAQLERANLVPEAHIPSKEVRDKRDLVRHHVTLVQQRTRLINQTKAALLRYNTRLPNNTFSKTTSKLANASQMPETLKLKLAHAQQQHALLQQELNETNTKIETLAQQDKNAILLHTIKGIGWFLAYGITTHIDNIQRFPTAENLISYAGLCPRTRQSGETTHTISIGHDNNHLLRWMLIQGAWSTTHHNPHFQKMFKKLCKKHCKQKAIVIIAKRLLTTTYYMLRDQTTFKTRGGH